MLKFENVSKSYGDKLVFRGLSRQFVPGAYALRGQNGIGKSTLLAVLAGVVPADEGSISIAGHPMHSQPVQAKARLSYVPDECPAYPFMNGWEFLKFVAQAKDCAIGPAVLDIATRLGLASHLATRFSEMSLGTQKKTLLAAAWIGEPDVILLDEPSNGLDRAAREVLTELLAQKARRSVVLMSTHDSTFSQGSQAQEMEFSQLQPALS